MNRAPEASATDTLAIDPIIYSELVLEPERVDECLAAEDNMHCVG